MQLLLSSYKSNILLVELFTEQAEEEINIKNISRSIPY
jgi:hypothetical protein